jgi:O-methyltransferase
MEQQVRELYLDLIKRTILGITYNDPSFDPSNASHKPFNQQTRENGEDWPVLAHTMVGLKRLNNIQELAEKVIANDIPGDFIETGVWRGGACIFANAIMKAYDEDRRVWVCDSFQGLPQPKDDSYPVDRGDTHWTAPYLSVSLEQVQANFASYNLLDGNLIFVQGWFSDTLPLIPEDSQFSILRLDGDMYESTIVALENLYPKLSVGGYLVVDDYGLPNCRQALTDYREFHGITDEYVKIDNCSAYWIKTKEVDAVKAKYRFARTK